MKMQAGVCGAAGALVLALCSAGPVAAQEPAPTSTSLSTTQPEAATPDKLVGQWHLNKDLSSQPSMPNDEPGQTGGGSRGRGGSGGSGGMGGMGGGGRGRGGGGMGGGGYGGRGGGGMGGYGGGASSPQVNPEDVLKLRALMRGFAEPAEVLNILVTPADVTTTDEHGAVQRIKTDGKKQSIDYGPGAEKIDTVAKWNGGVLTLDLSVGKTKVEETYQTSMQGKMMVVAVQVPGQGGGRGGVGGQMKFVYEKAE